VAREALVAPAVPVVQEVPAGPVVQAAAKLEHARVEAGLELVPAAEPAVNPVEVREPDRVAVPLKNKLATAAHHRGQVRVPKRVEDLAAAEAETTREPVVTEVATAWEAAE